MPTTPASPAVAFVAALFLDTGCAPAGHPAVPTGIESTAAVSLVGKVCATYAALVSYEDTGLLEEMSPMEHSVFPASVAPVFIQEAQFRTEFSRPGGRMLFDVQTMSLPMRIPHHFTLWTTTDVAHYWLGDSADQICDSTLYDGLASMLGVTSGLAGFIPYFLLGKAESICSHSESALLLGTENVRGVPCTIVRLSLSRRRLDIWVDRANAIRAARQHFNDDDSVDQIVFFDPHFPSEIEDSKFEFSPTAASAAPLECKPWLPK